MDFNFTPGQEAFRHEVRAFLAETLTPGFWQQHRERELPGWSPSFSRKVAERGWIAVSWPKEYGGQERGPIEQAIYMDEMAFAGAPQEQHRRAVQQVGPSIMLFGSEEQKQRYLPGIASAEISFAMGLSEPNAGSDLANVETRAVRDGDDWVITGTKRYTSGAHFSDYLWCVARTDPDAPKHRGISMFVVPLDAPGVEVRPLIDMRGAHHFNVVAMDQVRVPADHLVGEENRGWYINAQTMDLERAGGAHIGSTRRQPEHGIPDDASQRQSALAVESRAFPVFTYDPRRGPTMAERLSLNGNPHIREDWSKRSDGTIVDFLTFARTEGRFANHFGPNGEVTAELRAANEDRLQNWRALKEMAGLL